MGVSCFAYSHRLEVLATGSLDHAVRLWTPFSPQHPVACLTSHTSGLVGVAIAEQPHLLFSLAQDLSLCVWDIREHHLLQTISIKFPFTQRLPDFGPSPLSLLLLPSPTLTVSSNEYMAKFTLSAGAPSEGVRLDVSHTHPVCAVVYCPSLDQLVRGLSLTLFSSDVM
jgi:WD40 repeat protein